MDDKNELNDLLLGNQKESSSSKKFFLIAAGVLLLFFIIIGIMKFMGSSETKQPLPITSTEQLKKLPEPAVNSTAVKVDTNATPQKADNITANAGDEKLNAIVKKLQQDAQNQAGAPSQAAPTAEPAATATKQPIVVKQQAPEVTHQKQQPKTTVVTVPIKTAPAEQPEAKKQKEPAKKEDVKTAFKDATKNVAKPKPQPQAHQKQPAKQTDTNPKAAAATSTGAHFIQVGYFESEAAAKGLREKVNTVGFGSTTRQAVKNDKNITKVWVGPFESKEAATKALPKIREQIKSDAFIIKG